MKWIVNILVLFCLSTTVGMFINGCVHDPEFTITNPVDTNQVDPSGSNCDSTKVYFQNQIAPIFNSSCALAGCHDAIKHEEGIILDSYENIIRTGKIRAFDLNAGEIYDKITE